MEEHRDFIAAACCSRTEEKALIFRNKFGFERHYTDYAEMLKKEAPEAVLLCTPLAVSPHIAWHVLKLGYPLMLEKPPGRTSEEMKELISAAKDINMVAFNRRHMPLMVHLRSQLEGRSVQTVHYELYRSGRRDTDFSTTSIHGIDALAFIAGGRYARARIAYQPLEGDAVVNVFMQCEFSNGVFGTLHALPLSGAVIERAVVHWEGNVSFLNLPVWGGIEYENGFDTPGSLVTVREGQVIFEQRGTVEAGYVSNGFYGQLVYFLDCVRRGDMPVHKIESSLDAVQIMTCFRERIVNFSQN
jgi:predicted dehydrogenase